MSFATNSSGAQTLLDSGSASGDARCRVIGVLAQAGTTGPFNTDELVIVPVASAQQIFNATGLLRILVEAIGNDAVEGARRDVIAIVKARHQGEEDITVVARDAVLATFNSIFDAITYALAGIAAVSLVVAGVLIMNVMLVAVSQRTKEIGLLKALGAKQRQIIGLFLTEAIALSIMGALVGLACGILGTRLLNAAFPIIEFTAPSWALGAAVATAVASGLVFGILPARRAALLDPVEALAGR